MIATLRQRNDNFILWSAVKNTKGAFTPLGPVDTKHIIGEPVRRHSLFEGNRAFTVSERHAGASRLAHDEMLRLAEVTPPPDDWFEEDLSSLRRPGR